MSNLRQPNGDDYPEAARKHVDDAQALLEAARYDVAGYHAGYVVECALKTLLQIGGAPQWRYDLSALSVQAAALATGGSPQTARYIPLLELGVCRTRPDDRIDVPDLFLHGLGTKRRGGVKQ